MQLTWRGEVLLDNLMSQEHRAQEVFDTQDNWTLREVASHAPIDEDRFYSEVLKSTSVKPGSLRASVTRLIKKGMVEL